MENIILTKRMADFQEIDQLKLELKRKEVELEILKKKIQGVEEEMPLKWLARIGGG